MILAWRFTNACFSCTSLCIKLRLMNTSIKVLIVDDSEIVVERLNGIISEMPHISPVLISNNFQQAIELINLELPQVVLFDIHLSGQSSIELLSYIKSHYPAIKTLVVTNRVSDYYKELCEQNGADAFVDKSTEFEKIPSLIENFFCYDSAETNILN